MTTATMTSLKAVGTLRAKLEQQQEAQQLTHCKLLEQWRVKRLRCLHHQAG
jgi:hypothetical protein